VLCHETHRLCREAAREKKIDLTSSQYDAKDSEEDPLTLIDEKEVHPEALNPREELMRQEIRLAVELCFDSSLNEIEKSVLILCYHQFKSVIDVADELKIPKGSVGRYAHYAKARINDCLRKRYGIEPMDFYRSL
jgi:RNA polymerase sigma factor (sigma-70 family)